MRQVTASLPSLSGRLEDKAKAMRLNISCPGRHDVAFSRGVFPPVRRASCLGDFLPENLNEEAHGCDVRVASTTNITDLT